MKKIFILFILFISLYITGCGGSDDDSVANSELPQSAERTGIINVLVGNESKQVYVLPSEKTIEPVVINKESREINYSVDLISDNSNSIKIIANSGNHSLEIDTTNIQENTDIPFTLRITNKANSAYEDVSGIIYVISTEIVGQGRVGLEGGFVGDQWGDIGVRVDKDQISEDINVEIIKGETPDGRKKYRFKFDKDLQNEDGEIEFIIPRNVPQDDANNQSQRENKYNYEKLKEYKVSSREDDYPLTHNWISNEGIFIDNGGHRFHPKTLKLHQVFLSCGFNPVGNEACLEIGEASRLDSAISKDTPVDWSNKEPVLFVHGYSTDELSWARGAPLGGGDGTWKNFPDMISGLDIGNGISYIPFEFKWMTDARIEDVATELAAAVMLIKQKTGKEVHIIAHSFGGVLTRTVIQRLSDGFRLANPERFIADVTTLGTPHSGIADSDNKTMHGQKFMQGQDGLDIFEVCQQISCHQMGEDIFIGMEHSIWHRNFADILSIHTEPGELAANLADTASNNLPTQIPITVGIGLTLDRGATAAFDSGDALITYAGQRFHPNKTNDGEIKSLLDCADEFGPVIKEKILGVNSDVHPGDFPSELTISELIKYAGYKHSSFPPSVSINPVAIIISQFSLGSEAAVVCDNNDECDHSSYKLFKSALSGYVCDRRVYDIEDPYINLSLEVRSGTPNTFTKIEDANVRLVIGNQDAGVAIAEGSTDHEGKVNFTIPFLKNTEIFSIVSASGYHSQNIDSGFVLGSSIATSPTTFQTVYLQEDIATNGTLSFQVIDAVSGDQISTVDWKISKAGFVTHRGTTDNLGNVSILDLPRGTYTLDIAKEGYRDDSVICLVSTAAVNNCEGVSLRRILNADQASIRLTWDESPRDLDSHLVKYDANETQQYHIYYSNTRDSSTGDNLDLDDTSSFGPETTTIQSVDINGKYIFAVHHYAGSGSITTTSNASVTVDFGSTQPLVLSAPTTGDGIWWKVFEIEGGQIIPCQLNCIYDDVAFFSARSNNENLWLKDMLFDINRSHKE